MSIKKRILSWLLDLYLLPVRINSRIKRYAQEVTLMDGAGHLEKPVRFLQSRNLLSKEPVVIDIGAANGDTTEFFLEAIPNSRIFTFEANPQLAQNIKERFSGRPVNVFPMALSNKEGTVSFHIADDYYASSYKSITDNKQFQSVKSIDVPMQTLDFIMEKENIGAIDLLKLDVQGAETDVLQGAKNTLQKTKILVIEQTVRSFYVGGSKYYDVDELVRNEGFELLDMVITYRNHGMVLTSYDSIYVRKNLEVFGMDDER